MGFGLIKCGFSLPTRANTIAILSPLVLMVSSPHSVTAMVSGYGEEDRDESRPVMVATAEERR